MITWPCHCMRLLLAALCTVCALIGTSDVLADDGYRLWLRYDPLSPEAAAGYRSYATSVVVPGQSATLEAVRNELVAGLSGLLGRPVSAADQPRGGSVIAGTQRSSPFIAELSWGRELDAIGPEGFLIRTVPLDAGSATVIASSSETGALYGAFRFLRLVQTLEPTDRLDVRERPSVRLRVLNHWDNLDGTVERGYAGRSLWEWDALPGEVDPRLRDYARANASVGINGAVLNNVNASAKSLTPGYLRKTAAIADVFRPYGVRVYLSARFSAPIELGKLPTADPLNPRVAAWWRAKTDEIYALVPDFGGFLVKADSEGQPGPRTYNRTHADGANMLAEALAPHGGVVFWRAFVYDPKPDYDRTAAANDEFEPLDGKFADNVLLQVKNGPIDFQPREPFHPLFGAMPQTSLALEVQITQEYLGHATHLVYLAPMWRECLDADTHAKGPGSTVRRVVDGSLDGHQLTGVAGVANTGAQRNWTGHPLAQANWYAFGRLAWDLDASPRQIAQEWAAMSLSRDPAAVAKIAPLLVESHQAAVDYMAPLGLHHLMWTGHHYGPQPWWDEEPRPDWNPTYYHRADATGIGFDRTATGSNALSKYHRPVRERFADIETCPEEFLLWFHHVPWDRKMQSGRTLWDELALRYQRGVDRVRAARREWESLAGEIDGEQHAEVAKRLAVQEREAQWWRDACLLYFQTFSRLPLPVGVEPPKHTLQEYIDRSLLNADAAEH